MMSTSESLSSVRIYRMNWWRRIVALVLVGFGVVFLIAISTRTADVKQGGVLIGEIFLTAYVLIAAWWAAKVFSARVVLSSDSIEMRDIFSSRQLRIDAIRGRREYAVRGKTVTHYFKIEPADDQELPVEFEKNLNFDNAFYEWLYALPDLDQAGE